MQYEYDASGNRTGIGARTFAYDSRDQVTSGGGSTYSYTARGTLAATSTGGTQVASTFDAYGDQVTQGDQAYTYDGLGRVVSATGTGAFQFAYSGAGLTLASDGMAAYSYDPAGSLTGVAAGGVGVLALTDQHDDVVGQLSAGDAAALSGSRAYDPLGNVLASTGMVGNLGYQSGWTEPASSRVAMGSRWYTPGLGQFTSRDTAQVDPAGDAFAANPFAYVGDNPLSGTDPSGHFGMPSWLHKATSTVSSGLSSAWHATTSAVSSLGHKVLNGTKALASKATKKLKQAYHAAVKETKKVVNKVRKAATTVSHAIEKTVKQQVAAAKKKVVDAYHETVQEVNQVSHAAAKWAENHAELVGTIAGAAVGVALGAVCTGATWGVGAVGCGALAGMVGGAISGAVTHGLQVASGQAEGGWGGWLSAIGTSAALGAAGGALGGAIGGKVFGMVGKELLSSASVGTRVLSNAWAGGVTGFLTGGAMGAADYGVSCRKSDDCSLGGAVQATAHGAEFGAAFGAAGGAIGGMFTKPGASEPAAKQCGGCPCHSFDGATPVLMADGSSKPIKDVQLGDRVRSTDPATGEDSNQPVTALHNNHDTDQTDVTIKTGDGKTSTLHTTAHHPFWNATTSQWTNAADLIPGSQLHTLDNTETATVISIKTWTGLADRHDLTVANIHTYYVLAGATPILVHNCGTETRGSNTYSWEHEESGSLFEAEVDENGTMTMLAGVTKESPVRGIDLFNRALDHFGDRVTSINGNLIEENRATFNALTGGGMSPEEAILGTWTGKLATRSGFSVLKSLKLIGEPGNYSKVEPIFTRP